jgi:hypothetical protein
MQATFHPKTCAINETSSRCFTTVKAFGQRGTHFVVEILGAAALSTAKSAN